MRVLILAAACFLLSNPVRAEDGDELRPVPAAVLVGKPYAGSGAAAEIQFINVRHRAVRLNWIAFDGTPRLYATIPSGGELVQPTFVGHRWFVTPLGGAAPLEAFIATRADIHSDGQAHLATTR